MFFDYALGKPGQQKRVQHDCNAHGIQTQEDTGRGGSNLIPPGGIQQESQMCTVAGDRHEQSRHEFEYAASGRQKFSADTKASLVFSPPRLGSVRIMAVLLSGAF